MGRITTMTMLGAVLLAAVPGHPAGAAGADPLAAHRWSSRVLVVVGSTADDPAVTAQRAELVAGRAGADERDLVLIEALGAGAEAVGLRHRLGLPATGFRAVLVGKDGEAKLTRDRPIARAELFATIDAMPMRQDERRRR